MKKLALALILGSSMGFVLSKAMAIGPGANCPAATTITTDGGTSVTQSYFQVLCNLNNPIAMATDSTWGIVYWASEGTNDGGKFSDGVIDSFPIDGGVIKPLSPATQACPVSIANDGTNVIWVNAGTACSYGDGGAGVTGGAGNALLDVPQDGGTVATLVSGYEGIHKVVSDGTHAYFTVQNQQGPAQPVIGAVESVLLDAGAGYPVTMLWTSASGTAMVQGQLCTWVNGLATCPALGVVNQPIGNDVGSLALNSGELYWGPAGMTMPADGGAIPNFYGASLPGPEESIAPFDAGLLWHAGTGIMNTQGQWLANNADQYYGALVTDQTNIFFPCSSTSLNSMSVCEVAANQFTNYPVQVSGEFVAAPGSSTTSFSYTAAQPTIGRATYQWVLSSAAGAFSVASDNDAGYLAPTTTVLPSGFPKFEDGGVTYSTGAVFGNFSGPLPTGYNLTAQYTGTTTVKNPPVQTVLATGQPAIKAVALDAQGNLEWLIPGGPDAGSITVLAPK
jgi:hypothetical protein